MGYFLGTKVGVPCDTLKPGIVISQEQRATIKLENVRNPDLTFI